MNELTSSIWIEHDGKKWANQKTFALLLGIRTNHIKWWLRRHNITVTPDVTLDKYNQRLYPYEFVCTAILTSDINSTLGMELKRSLLAQLTQPKVEPKPEPTALLAPPFTDRAKLREKVACIATKYDIPYREVWELLWKHLYYRCHINVKLQAQNKNERPLDIIEKNGLCAVSLSILTEVYA